MTTKISLVFVVANDEIVWFRWLGLRGLDVQFAALEVGLIERGIRGDGALISLKLDEADAEGHSATVLAEGDLDVEDLTILLASAGELFLGNLIRQVLKE